MKVAIANRGEVAVRVIRACQEMGHQTVLLASEPDLTTLGARLADDVVSLGGNEASQNYLVAEKVIAAAKKAGCAALHPGFGFLSENADFADDVRKNGMIFVGPSGEVIRKMGNKISAKTVAENAGVPTIPGYKGDEQEPRGLVEHARRIGYPVLIKAASGGGGKGMRVCRDPKQFVELCESAQREAKAAFGSSRVFLEKYIEGPKHIEFQILGDQHGNMIHFFERDCSVQRRHQKIIEETPSPSLSDELRAEIGEAAVKLARSAGYYNAGTVEFLVDEKKNFYFMELNTRLQVEHPVTELVCGVDLVKLQFAVAAGEKLPLTQAMVQQRGHALELRLYAEDPCDGFLPSIGKILALELPTGPGRRFDFGLESGDEMTAFYDPMIGKLISWSETREKNLARMRSILNDTVVFGVTTNIEFLKSVLSHQDFTSGAFHTGFIEKNYPAGFQAPHLSKVQKEFIEQAKVLASTHPPSPAPAANASPDPYSPWMGAGGWRPS